MIAQSVAEILAEHVKLSVEGIDRIYLNVYVPRLQAEQGIVGFFRNHRGQPLPSGALMAPISRRYHGPPTPPGAARCVDASRAKALSAATAQAAAPAIIAPWNAASSAGPCAASNVPSKAVATSPPVRATALLKPEAAAVWRASTESSTAVVSGATAPDSPRAMTRIAGSKRVQ